MKRKLTYLMASMVLGACTLAPDYQRPILPVENMFPAEPLSSSATQYAYQLGWKEFFQDKRLHEYIQLALDNNKDLRVALLRVEEARLTHRVAQVQRLPSIDGSGSYSRQRQGQTKEGRSNIGNQHNYNMGVSNFELDFFGRMKSIDDVRFNEFLASVEGQKSVHISLISQVARSYFDNRLAIEQLQLARNTLSANQSSYDLVKQQVDAGIANDLDLAQALGQVHTASVQVAVFERQVSLTENTLYDLVGVRPTGLPAAKALNSQNLYKRIPGGLPSEVLLVRPDVMGSEYQLKAANASIGAARAAFFPRVALTTNVGTMSNSFSQLFKGSTGTWAFSPSFTVPIFNWGQTQAEVDIAHVRNNIAVANYEKTIQKAFHEVSDGLTSIGPYERQLRAQLNLVSTTSEQLRLANLLYTNGIANYLDVLDAQRTLFNARQQLLTTYHEQIMNAISLYTALGGGLVDSEKSINSTPYIAK